MSKEEIISINFNETPDIRDRVIKEDDTDATIQSKRQYPYEIFNTVTITIKTNKRCFEFDIYNGYTWNGADIPQVLWLIVGSRHNPEFRIPSMVHDYILQFRKYMLKEVFHEKISISEYRRLTSLIFRELLKKQGTNILKANVMSWCVDTFQHFFNRKEWKFIL